MRKWIRIILLTILLVGGAVYCTVRWQAWFAMPAEPVWTGDSISYVFPTPDVLDQPDSLRVRRDSVLTVLVLGDVHSRLTRDDYDTLASRLPQVDAVVQTGDWLERGQFYYLQMLLREWTNSALDSVPVITCPGNHEYSKGFHKSVSELWESTFAHPDNGPVGVPGESYYVDLPLVRFIAIDTNPLFHIVHLTRTITWLYDALYTAGDRYTVALMHHPVLPAGKGRFYPLIYGSFRHALGQADLVLAGHDHNYMRKAPFVVMNTSGRPKPQQDLFVPEMCDSVPVYGVLTLTRPSLQFTVHRLCDGTVIDSLYVNHD